MAIPKAKEAVEKALALDSSLAEAHIALAEVHWWGDWDFPAAEQEFRQAIELNPNEPIAYAEYANFLARLGIQVACRLIGKEQRGRRDQRPRNRYALLLPSGQLGWMMVLSALQPHPP